MEIKKRAQTKNRLLSLCLILVLLLGMFPISVTALDGAPQERVILYENIALRGEYEKHYLMSDGTSVALAFDHPVHYLLEGRWLDLDNRLILHNGGYENGQAENQVRLGGNTQAPVLLSYTYEAYTLSFSLLNTVRCVAARTQMADGPVDMQGKNLDDMGSFGYTQSVLYYPNILPGMDLEYVLSGNEVKENIYLAHADAWQPLSFALDCGGLIPILEEDRSIALCDTAGNAVLHMIAPYMFDAAGDISTQVRYLLSREDGAYILTLDADEEWLQSADRTYPVVVDPTLTVSGTANVTDTMVREGKPDQAYNSMKYAVVGYESTSSNRRNRMLIQMKTLPTIPTGNSVMSASLTVRQLSAANGSYSWSNSSVASMDLSARRITSSWVAAATWNTQPTFNDTILDTQTFTAATEYQTASFNITSAVQSWYTGSPNYGIMISRPDDSVSGGTSIYTSFYTSEHATEANKPVFSITYASYTGDESEPNDTSATADVFPFTYVGTALGSFAGKISNASDVDVIRFTMNETIRANIKMYVPATKDYNVHLFGNAALTEIIGSGLLGIGQTESFNVTLYKGKTYYLRVYGYLGAYSITEYYTLLISYKPVDGIDSNTYYKIKNVNSGKVLTVMGIESETSARQYTDYDMDIQKFQLEYYDGTYRLISLSSPSLSLNLPNNNDANGQNLQFTQYNYPPSLKFCFIRLSNGYYKIMPRGSGNKYMEVTYSSGADDAIIQIYQDNGQSCLEWELIPVSAGDQKIDMSFFSIGNDVLNPGRWDHSPYIWLKDPAQNPEYNVLYSHDFDSGYIGNINTHKENLLRYLTLSDAAYIEGHGYVTHIPDFTFVGDAYKTNATYLNNINLQNDIAKGFKSGSTTVTNTPFKLKTKWLIISACDQLNNNERGTNDYTAKLWAQALLGDGNRMHGVLGYFKTGPDSESANQVMTRFYSEQRSSAQKSMVDSWQIANETINGSTRTDWAAICHQENLSDNLFFGFSAGTTAGSNYNIVRYRRDLAPSPVVAGIAAPEAEGFESTMCSPEAFTMQALPLSSHQKANLQSALPAHAQASLEFLPNGAFSFRDFDNGYDGNLRAMSLSKEQALQQAEVYLQSLGLLPNSEYIAEVSSVVKERLDQDSFEFVDAQIVSYTVTLRHASQGRLISTADSNEGIMLRFTSRGIQTLDYQWGACAPLA